jgi:hypothetical protein
MTLVKKVTIFCGKITGYCRRPSFSKPQEELFSQPRQKSFETRRPACYEKFSSMPEEPRIHNWSVNMA